MTLAKQLDTLLFVELILPIAEAAVVANAALQPAALAAFGRDVAALLQLFSKPSRGRPERLFHSVTATLQMHQLSATDQAQLMKALSDVDGSPPVTEVLAELGLEHG